MLKAVEAVPAIAHYPAGLGYAAKLLGQFQQADLRLDYLPLGHRHDGHSSGSGRGAALRIGSAPRPPVPPIPTVRQITSRLLQLNAESCALADRDNKPRISLQRSDRPDPRSGPYAADPDTPRTRLTSICSADATVDVAASAYLESLE